MKIIRIFCLAGVLLAACAESPPDYYVLGGVTPPPPPSSSSSSGQTALWRLAVMTPEAGGGLDTARIAVRPRRNELAYYAGARWPDPAPRMVRRRLMDGLQDGGIITAGDGSSGADYTLVGDLRSFESAIGDDGVMPDVHVDLTLSLMDGNGGDVASRRFRAVMPSDSPEITDVVRAFDGALDLILADAVPWLRESGTQAFSTTPAALAATSSPSAREAVSPGESMPIRWITPGQP